MRLRPNAVLPFLLTLLPAVVACGERGDEGAEQRAAVTEDSALAGAAGETISVEDGLQAPESVLHDAEADVYLVSNIAGQGADRDDNGFISRVSPDGRVENLRWIAGGADGVTLHAPKGLGIRGDSLFVADIDVVRIFDRNSGAPLGEWSVPDATFLNDVSVGPDGTVYTSDSAVSFGPNGATPSGNPAVYRFDDAGVATVVAQGSALQGPNGVYAAEDGVYAVTMMSNQLLRLPGATAQPGAIARVPGGQLDGIVQLPGGAFLVSSWETSTVYRVDAAGEAVVAVEGVAAPADIGYDARRDRVLIPQLSENRLQIRQLPPHL